MGYPAKRAQNREKTETVATLPGNLGLIPIARLSNGPQAEQGKPKVIARVPEPCSPDISLARSRIGPGSLASVSKNRGKISPIENNHPPTKLAGS